MVEVKFSLDQVLNLLDQEHLCFFPIRHHSPACAWHLQHWIRSHHPAAILIEGPRDASELIPLMLHPESKAPFALYLTYVDPEQKEVGPGISESGPHRWAGYFPLCDYSPELVALRSGAEVGAQLQFIDLTYAEQVLCTQLEGETPHMRALQEERYLQRSEYLQSLARKTGCRDHDDLWDHLFEIQGLEVDVSTFMAQVATYCWIARQDADLPLLQADGTMAREAQMAAAITQTLKSTSGKVLVVTGGFHTVALPFLIFQDTAPEPPKFKKEATQTVLMRYSFEQLDALNGYGAGMPAPSYYQRLWQTQQKGDPQAQMTVACQFLIDLARLSRENNRLTPLSVADEIAALEQTLRLAQFRGHAGPSREDLLDGIRSCFVKGAMDGEGALLMATVQRVLRGDAIGDLPAGVGVPPLVEDFRRLGKELRLKLDSSSPKKLSLDLYRKRAHRQISRLLHCLSFLKVPFASMTGGPDFVRGTGLDRILENWEYRWTPQTESQLIEASVYGTTVQEAALAWLQEEITRLGDEGEARSATTVVTFLIQACCMGLHTYIPQIMDLIQLSVATDPDFESLVQAVTQLTLLWQSREPLQAHELQEIPELARIAYQRLCYLIPQLNNCPEDRIPETLSGLGSIWELLNQPQATHLDQELFVDALMTLLQDPQGHSVILGGATGILHTLGIVDRDTLVTQASGYLQQAVVNPAQGVGYLRGLLRTCREVAWTITDLMAAIQMQLEKWEDEEFLRVLPELRLAFADLIPRETDRVAAIVAGFQGQTDLGNLFNLPLSAADLAVGVQVNALVETSLRKDQLWEWIQGSKGCLSPQEL
jgi:hypothetical protein